MDQMKEQIKTPKIELSEEEITSLSDAEFQPMVIKIHRNGWVWLQNGGKSEGYAKWSKENIQGTNSEGKETWTQINDLEQKEEINIPNWNRMKKQEFKKKNEETL